jgi:hypothetical protein
MTELVKTFKKDIGNKCSFPPKLLSGQIFTTSLTILEKSEVDEEYKKE